MPFQYKCVLLVGATSGIGAAMADKLIQEGSKVIAVGRRQQKLDEFVKRHGPERASAIRFDTTDKAGMDDFINRVTTTFPDLDCVFLNSGVQSQVRLSRPKEVDLDAFHTEIDINFTSIVNLVIKFLPFLESQPRPTGLIITGTHLALVPAVTIPAYSASKAALSSFVYCLRRQNQAAKTRIIEIWPPVVRTELHDYMGEEKGRSLGMPVAQFTDECYNQLLTGSEHVVIGSVGPQDSFLSLIDRRKEHFDNLSNIMLATFEL